jgi:hypothetical protein
MENEKLEAITCEAKTKCGTCTSTTNCAWVSKSLENVSNCVYETSLNYFGARKTKDIHIKDSDFCPDNAYGFNPIIQSVPGKVCPLSDIAPWDKCVVGYLDGDSTRRDLSCVGMANCESSCTKHGFKCVQLPAIPPVWNRAGDCCLENMRPDYECQKKDKQKKPTGTNTITQNQELTASEAKDAEQAASPDEGGSPITIAEVHDLPFVDIEELEPETPNEEGQQITKIEEEVPLAVTEAAPFAAIRNEREAGSLRTLTRNAQEVPTYEGWLQDGKPIPENMVFAGGSARFDESTGMLRSDKKVYDILHGTR